mgnify:CR=1 FL=1
MTRLNELQNRNNPILFFGHRDGMFTFCYIYLSKGFWKKRTTVGIANLSHILLLKII